MPGKSYSGDTTTPTVEELVLANKLNVHVKIIAREEHNTLHPEALNNSAKYIEQQLAEIGYEVSLQPFRAGTQQVRNIEVELKGKISPSEIIVIGAHYDSAQGAPGANDNASGVALLIELARFFKSTSPQKSLRFVFFTNEEPPFFGTDEMGSVVYAKRSKERSENIVGMVSLETLGYYDDAKKSQKSPLFFRPFFPDKGNFVAFVGNFSSRQLVRNTINSFRVSTKFPSEGIVSYSHIIGIDWSDQYAFWRYGYPAVMLTDTALFRYPYYHTHNDTVDRVNYIKLAKVYGGTLAVVGDLAGASIK